MFAYCLNNPTSNIDNHGNLCRPSMIALNDCGNPPVTTPHVAGSPSTQTWGTVSGQDLLPYSSNTCGLGTYAHNGCALIAVYNAMQLIGKPHSLQAVTDAFFWDYGMVAFGLLGVGPWSMDNYFDANGVNYIGSSNASSLTSDISEGSVIIYTVMFSGGWHAMTACYTNGVYIVFNQYDNDPTPNDYDSLADSYSNGVWIYGYRIDP